MADLNNIADSIRTMAERFRGILDLADALDKIGSLDGAAQDAKTRMETAKAEEAGVTARVESLRLTLQDEERANAARVEQAEAKARDIVAGAEANAKAVQEGAAAMASAIEDEAKAKAQAIIDRANQVAQSDNEAAALSRVDLAMSRGQLEDVTAQVAEAQTKLDRIKAAIADIAGK